MKGSSPRTQKGAQRYNEKLRNPNNQEMSPHRAYPRAVMGEMPVPLLRDETHHDESMERFSSYSSLDVCSLLRKLPETGLSISVCNCLSMSTCMWWQKSNDAWVLSRLRNLTLKQQICDLIHISLEKLRCGEFQAIIWFHNVNTGKNKNINSSFCTTGWKIQHVSMRRSPYSHWRALLTKQFGKFDSYC